MLPRWDTSWSDFDEAFSAMGQLKTYMDRVFEDTFGGRLADGGTSPLT